jgi:CDP-glucose 4,6-dehydratase
LGKRQCAVETLVVTPAQVNPNFWAERSVFVTGHTGFKGAWLSLWLQQMGATVTGFSLAPPTTPNLFQAAAVGNGMDSIMGDIRDYDSVAGALRASGASIVFHLAAQSIVSEGYRQARDTFATNLTGTVNLLDAMRESAQVRAAVIVTSDKCYAPSLTDQSLVEDDPMGGKDPYSASKSCAEIAVASWRHSFFDEQVSVRVATARAGNVIGGGDWSTHRLLPDIARAFIANETLTLRMPNAVRPWQHVLDALSGYLLLAEKLSSNTGDNFARAWNFGPAAEDHLTAQEVAEVCAVLWGDSAKIATAESNFQKETQSLRLDATQAHSQLAWYPSWSANVALRHTIDWYRQWHSRSNDAKEIRQLTSAQIEQYMATSSNALN